MCREAFSLARLLSVKTCVGTEVPMTYRDVMPTPLLERIRAQKRDPGDPAVVREVYEAMFERIAKTHPLDYYWLWTNEGWRGRSNAADLALAMKHFTAAYQALHRVGAPFRLATCGWQLGPEEDRAAYDRLLPKDVAVSSINTELGHNPVDPAFARVHGRQKWAIPWLEDDLALANPQLWVGRTRKDAADALAYGCTGLLGIHWRTDNIAPNFAALAQAGWSQSPWNPEPGKVPASAPTPLSSREGPTGGQVVGFPGSRIAGTEESEVYRTCRYGLAGYRFNVPAGKYRVTLKFCEPAYDAVGKRVFDVTLQGRPILEKFDIFAKVGKFAAMDFTYEVTVAEEGLTLEFASRVDNSCISGIVIEGQGLTRKVNCGGPRYNDFASDVDWPGLTPHTMHEPRGLSTTDFYADWARGELRRRGRAGSG